MLQGVIQQLMQLIETEEDWKAGADAICDFATGVSDAMLARMGRLWPMADFQQTNPDARNTLPEWLSPTAWGIF